MLHFVTNKVTIVTEMSTMFGNNNPGTVLFGKSRRAILTLLYGHVDEEFYLRQIVRNTGLGIGPVQRELKQLADSSILQRRIHGHQVYYQANPETPIFEELKNIVRKTFGVADILKQALIPGGDRIKVAFIFGSTARSADDKRSDIDLMVIGDVGFTEIASDLYEVQETLGREVNPKIYSKEEWMQMKNRKDAFIKEILAKPRLIQ